MKGSGKLISRPSVSSKGGSSGHTFPWKHTKASLQPYLYCGGLFICSLVICLFYYIFNPHLFLMSIYTWSSDVSVNKDTCTVEVQYIGLGYGCVMVVTLYGGIHTAGRLDTDYTLCCDWGRLRRGGGGGQRSSQQPTSVTSAAPTPSQTCSSQPQPQHAACHGSRDDDCGGGTSVPGAFTALSRSMNEHSS